MESGTFSSLLENTYTTHALRTTDTRPVCIVMVSKTYSASSLIVFLTINSKYVLEQSKSVKKKIKN